MARTDRLYALTEYLRRRRHPVTVARIAEALGVCERTAYRDLAVLRAEGVPIDGDVGRGGGVWLRPEYSMPPIALAVEEAAALWLALRLARLGPAGPWPRGTQGALDKVLGALPPDRRKELHEMVGRVVVAGPASAEVARTVGAISPAVFSACEKGLRETRLLHVRYRDGRRRLSRRLVEPHGLEVMPPAWYLLAVDQGVPAPRAFRIDRILSARVDAEGRFRPRDPRILFPEIGRAGVELAE